MRWYINDHSLQGQFPDAPAFEAILRALLASRKRSQGLRSQLRTTRTFSAQLVTFDLTVRTAMQQSRDRDLKIEVLSWLNKTGPFIDDDRLLEAEDYFEYAGVDVTEGGLGEAARRVKAGETASTFSFEGGKVDFRISPLRVDHGLADDRLGIIDVANTWTVEDLTAAALSAAAPILSWRELVLSARERFPQLLIPDSVYLNSKLSREPFDAVIRDRALVLLSYLDGYMAGRLSNGEEGPRAREIVEKFFSGDRALFTGESTTNERAFKDDLTFPDPGKGKPIFAPWHGKISHRFFRMHFEWPVPAGAQKLKILYLGPKITKG
ncbi:MAG: hypothetical protein ABW277_15505 [Longimicrobiaceae bacterium]